MTLATAMAHAAFAHLGIAMEDPVTSQLAAEIGKAALLLTATVACPNEQIAERLVAAMQEAFVRETQTILAERKQSAAQA